MVKHLLVFVFVGVTSLSFAQTTDTKEWNTPLTWCDFQGRPNASATSHALTNMGITVEYSWKDLKECIQLTYQVRSVFNSLYSWVKEGKKSDHLLMHEQTHFDITELHARKIRKFFSEHNFDKRKVRMTIDQKLDELQRLNHHTQEEYDRETRHGTHKKQQLEWTRKIKAELKLYEAYKNPAN